MNLIISVPGGTPFIGTDFTSQTLNSDIAEKIPWDFPGIALPWERDHISTLRVCMIVMGKIRCFDGQVDLGSLHEGDECFSIACRVAGCPVYLLKRLESVLGPDRLTAIAHQADRGIG